MKDMQKCFADKEGYCMALEEKECKGCVFFKTKEQQLRDRRKAKEYNDAKGILNGTAYSTWKREQERLDL